MKSNNYFLPFRNGWETACKCGIDTKIKQSDAKRKQRDKE